MEKQIVLERDVIEHRTVIGKLRVHETGPRRYTWTFMNKTITRLTYPTVDMADWAAGEWAGSQGWFVRAKATGTRAHGLYCLVRATW